jgi:hypothetical protein
MRFIRLVLIHEHQPVRVAKREGLEQNAADNGEERHVGANSKRDHDHRDEGESRRPAEGAYPIAEIPRKRFHPVPRPDGTRLLANQPRISESALSRIARLLGRQAILPLFFFFEFKIRPKLALEISISLSNPPPSHFSSPPQSDP